MWDFRKILRIPWTPNGMDVSILKELNITNRLSSRISPLYLRYFGHISRRTNGVKKYSGGRN